MLLCTVKHQFYVPVFCDSHDFMDFFCGPGQMPIRTMFLGYYGILSCLPKNIKFTVFRVWSFELYCT